MALECSPIHIVLSLLQVQPNIAHASWNQNVSDWPTHYGDGMF